MVVVVVVVVVVVLVSVEVVEVTTCPEVHVVVKSSRSSSNSSWSTKYGWMDDLRFYVLFNSISVIAGRCEANNERLCAMKLRLRLRRCRLERGSISVR